MKVGSLRGGLSATYVDKTAALLMRTTCKLEIMTLIDVWIRCHSLSSSSPQSANYLFMWPTFQIVRSVLVAAIFSPLKKKQKETSWHFRPSNSSPPARRSQPSWRPSHLSGLINDTNEGLRREGRSWGCWGNASRSDVRSNAPEPSWHVRPLFE